MNDLQRTPEWYLARKGKITASEIEQVLHKGKKDVFSAGCITYLKEAVAEQFMTAEAFLEEKENEPTPYACRHGIFWEDKAREVYCERTGIIVADAPFLPLKGFEGYAGGSPDGLANDNGLSGIVEIKCPKTTAIHLDHFLCKTQEDLKAYNPKYYTQCQMNMILASQNTGTDAQFCDFISYDPRVMSGMDLKVLRILPDLEFQKELLERVGLAIDWMEAYKIQLITM